MALEIVRNNIGKTWESRTPHREFGTKNQLTTWQQTADTPYTSEQMGLRVEGPSTSLSWCGFKPIKDGRHWISASLELVEGAGQVKWRYITSDPMGVREGSATLDAKAGLMQDFLHTPLRIPRTRSKRDASPRRTK
jgi:hypothetical protein